jgi:hypothetical protein
LRYKVFLAKRNSDLTEGRGQDVIIAAFSKESDASLAARGWGVMGVGNGTVEWLTVYNSYGEYLDKEKAELRASALAKLSHEEKIALGLLPDND